MTFRTRRGRTIVDVKHYGLSKIVRTRKVNKTISAQDEMSMHLKHVEMMKRKHIIG